MRACNMERNKWRLVGVGLLIVACGGQSALAEKAKKAARAGRPEVASRAFVGEPFGVAEVTLTFPENHQPVLPPDRPVSITDEAGRALYPSVSRSYEDGERTRLESATVRFLFRGENRMPFDVRITADGTITARITPDSNADARKDVLESWWAAYRNQFRQRHVTGTLPAEEPDAVETYLTTMLARRLDLTPPDAPRRGRGGDFDEWSGIAELVVGTASVRAAMQRETLLETSEAPFPADLPLPEPTAPPAIELPGDFHGAIVEPLAHHVPEECFYIRCRGVNAYHWLRTALGTMSTFSQGILEAHTTGEPIHEKLERQLALRASTVPEAAAKLVVDELAVIGTDPFVREGAAIGVVLHTDLPDALAAWIKAERKHVRQTVPGVTEKTLSIGGREVQLLSTKDNRVRSFHVADEDGTYHLVTNSESIATRFIECGHGIGSLGGLKEFQYARAEKFPPADDGPLFLYLSDPFFRFFVSPRYRIEMTRRAKADAELELIELARLAAVAEGQENATLRDLVAADVLPESILWRPDDSSPVLKDGRVWDSLRGARGHFLPVPDVTIKGATPAEVEAYRRFAEMYRREWTRTDPVAVAVRSRPDEREGLTRIVFDIAVTPFARRHYGFVAAFLPKPDHNVVTAPPGNLVFLQAGIPEYLLNATTTSKDGILHLFIGLQDVPLRVEFHRGEVIEPDVDDDEWPWFAGHVGADTLLDWLERDLNREEIEEKDDGFVQRGDQWFQLWDKRWGAIARSREVLAAVTPHLTLTKAERPAQLRLRLADLSETQVRPFLEANAYAFARRASARNANLLHQMSQQFRLEPKAARATVERVFDAELACPLGGEYRLTGDDDGPREWVSTRWPKRSRFQEDAVPPGFRHPFLEGLHGAEVELTLSIPTETLSSHVELVVPAAAGLPKKAPAPK